MVEIESIPIGPYRIGPDHSPLVIAEAAVNHQGDFETAKRMVYIAHAMGAHIIKFQIHVLDNEMLARDAAIGELCRAALCDAG
jgi:sialic acid synthase SpsE